MTCLRHYSTSFNPDCFECQRNRMRQQQGAYEFFNLLDSRKMEGVYYTSGIGDDGRAFDTVTFTEEASQAFGKFPFQNIYNSDLSIQECLRQAYRDLERGAQLANGDTVQDTHRTLAEVEQDSARYAHYKQSYKHMADPDAPSPAINQTPFDDYVLTEELMQKIRKVFPAPNYPCEEGTYSDQQCANIFNTCIQDPSNPTYMILSGIRAIAIHNEGLTFGHSRAFHDSTTLAFNAANPGAPRIPKRDTITPAKDQYGVGFLQSLHVEFLAIMISDDVMITETNSKNESMAILDVFIQFYVPLRPSMPNDKAFVKPIELALTARYAPFNKSRMQNILKNVCKAIIDGWMLIEHDAALREPTHKQMREAEAAALAMHSGAATPTRTSAPASGASTPVPFQQLHVEDDETSSLQNFGVPIFPTHPQNFLLQRIPSAHSTSQSSMYSSRSMRKNKRSSPYAGLSVEVLPSSFSRWCVSINTPYWSWHSIDGVPAWRRHQVEMDRTATLRQTSTGWENYDPGGSSEC